MRTPALPPPRLAWACVCCPAGDSGYAIHSSQLLFFSSLLSCVGLHPIVYPLLYSRARIWQLHLRHIVLRAIMAMFVHKAPTRHICLCGWVCGSGGRWADQGLGFRMRACGYCLFGLSARFVIYFYLIFRDGAAVLFFEEGSLSMGGWGVCARSPVRSFARSLGHVFVFVFALAFLTLIDEALVI